MDKSVFLNKQNIPSNNDLMNALGYNFNSWQMIKDYVLLKYPSAIEEWNYPSDKYGWSFRIKDKKRVILYLLPREKFFKVAFVFGQKAFNTIMESQISNTIKIELDSAKKYAEGRGIRIDIINDKITNDIKELIDIKLSN